MAEVYLAGDTKFDRLIALKVLRPRLGDDAAKARFIREATVSGRLLHPNIVTVYDFGEQDDVVFIAMEYVAGESLAERVRRREPPGLRDTVALMIALCEGLAVAHDAGVLHRDLKPDNLMLSSGGVLKIVDFGIARILDATKSITFAGTPRYMSPEQFTGAPLDARSDIFAVGGVLYELLTCEQAFTGDDMQDVSEHIVYGTPRPIQELAPATPSSLVAIVERALAKSPDDRFQDVRSLQRALREVLPDLPAEATTVVALPRDDAAGHVAGDPIAGDTITVVPGADAPSIWGRILARLLNGQAHWDYLWLALVATVPMAVAVAIGAFSDMALTPASPLYEQCVALGQPIVAGYGSKLNWSLLFAIIPFELFILRRVAAQLFAPDGGGAARIALVRKIPAAGRDAVSAALRGAALDPRNLLAVLLVTTVINVIDVREILSFYTAPAALDCPRELDWTVRVLAGGDVSYAENLWLVILAYPCQFLVHAVGLLIFALLLRHNLFYLAHIFQRHRSATRPATHQIVLDFDDAERCFGLRELHSAFNFQIVALISGGLLLLTSRVVNVDATPIGLYYEQLLSRLMPGMISAPASTATLEFQLMDLFPDAGQVMIGLAWMVCFLIVALPSAVKFLPLINKHVRLVGRREYLQEFIPESTRVRFNTQEELDRLAGKFSRSSFWPAGDERARVLYAMAYFVFLFLLVPAPPTSRIALAMHAVIMLALAYLWMKVTFWIFRRVLATIDATLTQ